MQRAIITGATGAIGVALVQYLLKQNIEVLAIVNPQSQRIQHLPKDKRLRVIEHSVTDLKALNMEKIGMYDAFFHLAWQGTIGAGRDDMYLQNANVQYTLDAVALAARCQCKVFLGAGSQAEYGRVEGKLTAKTATNPETGYGIAKLCAGQMSRIQCEQLHIRHIWTRILSIYGPYDGEKTMIVSGILQMLQGERPVFSAGEQVWDYLYSEDAARALYLAADNGKDGSIYPIGSGQGRPLRDYILLMQKAVGEQAEVGIGELPYRKNQVMHLCADITELTRDTGFLPKITFDEGIKQTVEWCKQLVEK